MVITDAKIPTRIIARLYKSRQPKPQLQNTQLTRKLFLVAAALFDNYSRGLPKNNIKKITPSPCQLLHSLISPYPGHLQDLLHHSTGFGTNLGLLLPLQRPSDNLDAARGSRYSRDTVAVLALKGL